MIVAPLAVSAGAQVAQLDEASSLLLLAAGLIPWLWPPALVALAIGLWRGRPLLAVVAAATTGVLLASAVAGLGLPTRARPAAGTLPTVRLFTANVHDANPDMGPIAEEIAAVAPDLVALQEIDPDGAAGLARSGVLDRFPYSVTETRRGASGIALWSRFPLVDAQVQDVLGRPFIGATVMVGAKRLRLYTVHTVAPLGGDRAQWQAQLRRVRAEVRATMGALVVAGDFNASRHHPSFRRLLSDGLRDAHERRGRGWRRPGRGTDGHSRPCCGSTTSWYRQALRCKQSRRASVRAATTGRSSPTLPCHPERPRTGQVGRLVEHEPDRSNRAPRARPGALPLRPPSCRPPDLSTRPRLRRLRPVGLPRFRRWRWRWRSDHSGGGDA